MAEADLQGGPVVHQLIHVKADAAGRLLVLDTGQCLHQGLFEQNEIVDVVDVNEAVPPGPRHAGIDLSDDQFFTFQKLFGNEDNNSNESKNIRNNLNDDEKATISLFENAAPSVAFITTSNYRRDYWTRNITEIPRGTGSAFVWDKKGHIITNKDQHHYITDQGDCFRMILLKYQE